MHRRRVAVAVAAISLTACADHTVAIRFEPDVGDTYDLRSAVDTEVVRIVAGDPETERSESRLDATERVVAVDDDEIAVEVTVARDGSPARTFEVRFDPSGRLSAIDLVQGVPTDALGLDLATGLPAAVVSPPAGPLEPGATWTIEETVGGRDGDGEVTVTGTGRLESLGVVDGIRTGVVVVELTIPLRTVTDTADGRITVRGSQTVESRTDYDLDDGTARSDRTDIRGDIDVLVEPPEGIDAPPVPGRIRYRIETETARTPTG